MKYKTPPEDIRQFRQDLLKKRFRAIVKRNRIKRRIIEKLEHIVSWFLCICCPVPKRRKK